MLEVCMDNMKVKFEDKVDHVSHLCKVFENKNEVKPQEMGFWDTYKDILRFFFLTEGRIEANLDKCKAFTEIPALDTKIKYQVIK